MIGKRQLKWAYAVTALAALLFVTSNAALAQVVIDENFDGVTESGGGEFFTGNGFGLILDWDTGITGEFGFGLATDRAYAHISAEGDATAGVSGTGAGVISVTDVTFNPLNLDFEDVSGNPGGGIFFDSNGVDEGYTDNWDSNIDGEAAFGGVADGAVLNGRMTAQALPGFGYAELDVDDVDVTLGLWYAGLIFSAPPLEGAVTLLDGSFESFENGDPIQLTYWGRWDNSGWGGARSEAGDGDPVHPFTEYDGRALKMYGDCGVWQELPAQETQVWEINAVAMAPSNDAMGSQNYVEALIEFRDAGDAVIGTNGVVILTSASTQDVWLPVTLQGTAPAGTATARVLFAHYVPSFEGGAALVDGVSFDVVSGPAQSAVDLSTISLTADVRGTVDAGGETLGDYFLRIEDTDGNRLVFEGTADGTWQTIGGSLDTAVEMNSNGVTTNGVFNPLSPGFAVVVTFDNDSGVTWGTGGTLDVDNVILTGDDPKESAWAAGLYWDDLTLPTTDMSAISLTADVLGDVVDGAYDLRLEGFIINSNGVDESFDDVTGTGGQVILTYDMTTSGTYSSWTPDWDSGIVEERAFGGLDVGSELCNQFCPGEPDVGIVARGITPDGYGMIKMHGIDSYAPGGDFWAGLMWWDQALASSDLSQVTLTVDVRGVVDTFFGEQLGSIELRIEDEQGDRLYKRITAPATWTQLGGTLDTFIEAGPASGSGGDGAFNTDGVNYTVVIAFDDPRATWLWGGEIHVDNLYITPADVKAEIGRVSFAGVADGTFQSVGGTLDTGASTFQTDLTEDMESAAGDSLTFWPGSYGGVDFDSGLENDEYFAGTWGSGTVTATVRTCSTCGFNSSSGFQMTAENPATGVSGGWWGGIALYNNLVDITNLEDIVLTAKAKAETAGTYGALILKLEDANLDGMQYEVIADGTWQTLGGAITAANGWVEVGSGNTSLGSDGVFDINSPSFKVVLVTEGPHGAGPDWDATYTFTMDDVFLTRPGRGFADAETFTATLAFADEMATWGTAGTLIIDNLTLGSGSPCADADVNCDGNTDVLDMGVVRQGSNWNQSPPTGNARADINNDGTADILDLGIIRQGANWNTSTGPCTCP